MLNDRMERRALQKEMYREGIAKELQERRKEAEGIKRELKKLIEEGDRYLKRIRDEFGGSYSKTPKEIVKSAADAKSLGESLRTNLEAFFGVLNDFEDFIAKKEFHSIQRLFSSDIFKEFMEKTKDYIFYWGIIERKGKIPGPINRWGRRDVFKSFDEISVNLRINVMVTVLDQFKDALRKS